MSESFSMSPTLADKLADPSRPVFLLGDVPPMQGTPPGKCQTICEKFSTRSRALATDGFIVYDIQDEPGRSDVKRPFPFRQLMESSAYGALLARTAGKPVVVYKCIADEHFDEWLDKVDTVHGHSAINLVGRPSSQGVYKGPSIGEAMKKVVAKAATPKGSALKFGCVCIAERHTLEAAKARNKDYPTEHLNMLRKQQAGAKWFISQAVYDSEPTIRLLRDYAAVCKQRGIVPAKVVLTFCPVSRKKTMNFIQWLGVRVPQETEDKILNAEQPVDASIEICCQQLQTILAECAGLGIPLGISCESVSIFKAEIDGVHELFRRLQGILMDSRGSPWKVQWVDYLTPTWKAREDENKEEKHSNRAIMASSHDQSNESLKVLATGLTGAALGGALVAAGVFIGSSRKVR